MLELKLDEARVRVSSWSYKLLVQVLFTDCFILIFAYLLIYWSLLWCLWCLEKMGVSLSWSKVRVLSKMYDLAQLMLNLSGVCVYVTRKGALFDMNMKWNYVWCFFMMLGCTKVCLHALRKEFKLRIGMKTEGTN